MAHHEFLRQLGIFTVPGFLSPQECARWRELAASSDGVEARIYRDREAQLDEEQRKTLAVTVKHPLQIETERRMEELRGAIEVHFGVELDGLDNVHCLVYRTGDFFRLHADVSNKIDPQGKYAKILRRRVTVVVFLNHPGDGAEPYEGGELRLYGLMGTPAAANFGFPAEAESGLLIAFPATTMHEVSPVTGGKRYTLVTWFLAGEPEASDDHQHDLQTQTPRGG
jgi:PKHD-type hydroxylase